MERESDGVEASRGTKRKRSIDGKPRLTFAQKLAAARKSARSGGRCVSPTPDTSVSQCLDVDVPSDQAPVKQDDEYFRKLYDGELDFQALGKSDTEFRLYLREGRYMDFNEPKAVMQLTKTLLKHHFDLQINLPSDRLCPPMPNRHNYILWLKDLLDTSSSTYSDVYDPDRHVLGLDIGTGASAIYPLLGCVQRPTWSFIATDIDSHSLDYARENVELNKLQSRIRLVERPVEGPLLPLDEAGIDHLDFVMTNPPFYTSKQELLELAEQKAQPPNGACTGAPNEMVCEGGEIGFIKRILDESLELKDRVQWYTSMLGKQSSLEIIVGMLKEHDIENYAVTEFVQGSKTRRWAVGWSFGNRRPGSKACRGFEPAGGKKLLPPPTEMTVATKATKAGAGQQLENVFWTQLEDVTEGLDLVSWSLDEERLRGVGFADGNVWSRAYRRSKERRITSEQEPEKGGSKALAECAFGFSIAIETETESQELGDKVAVVVRWLQGADYALFESFCGMLRNAFLNVVTAG